jgi:hypothetical protein
MSTQEINGKRYTVTVVDGGALICTPIGTPIVDVLKEREPEAGDVWQFKAGQNVLLTDNNKNVVLKTGVCGFYDHKVIKRHYKFKGKHDDVYVKIADVRTALEVATKFGLNALNYLESGASGNMCLTTKDKTLDALRELNII